MATKNPAINATTRTLMGRKVKQLRRQGIIPANIFGNKIDSQALSLNTVDFLKITKDIGESTVIDVKIEGESKTRPVLLSNVQEDPISGDILHVDLKQVDLKVKVTASVELNITGEAPGVKELGGVLLTPVNEIEVEALPNDLPDHIDVDVSSLAAYGDSITVADIKVGDRVEIITDAETMVAILQEQQSQEEAADEDVSSEDDEASTDDSVSPDEVKEDGDSSEASQ